MDFLLDRIDAALERMRLRGRAVRTITLDEKDRAEFDAINTKAWREHLGSEATFYATQYREHFLRSGHKSIVFGENGEEVIIPKRLSKKVRPK